MRKLYHGTSLSMARRILKEGLLPRASTNRSNWKNAPSGRDRVYLTDSYPLYFAVNATRQKDRPCVIEVNADAIPWMHGVADEDVLEQIGRGKDDLDAAWDMRTRTRHYRDNAMQYAARGLDMEWSLDRMGTCAVVGGIPASAITRIAHLPTDHPVTMAGADASISLMNFRFCRGGHRMLTKWLFEPRSLPPMPDDIAAMNLRDPNQLLEAIALLMRKGICDVATGEDRTLLMLWRTTREGVTVEARQPQPA